jgi:hypothetical protein
MIKKLRDYILEGTIRDERGNPRWFVSKRFEEIYCIYEISKKPIMHFRSYHPFCSGFPGASDLSLLLDDFEATEEDHKKMAEKERKYWESLSFEEQRQHIQFDYDMGANIPQEVIEKYKIETID